MNTEEAGKAVSISFNKIHSALRVLNREGER